MMILTEKGRILAKKAYMNLKSTSLKCQIFGLQKRKLAYFFIMVPFSERHIGNEISNIWK